MSSLQIKDFHLTDLFSLDCGNISPESCNINSFRGVNVFLDNVKLKMLNTESYGFKKPIYNESEYAKTDRVGRNTFSAYFAYNLMPLYFESINPTQYQDKDLLFCFKGIRISPKMSITISINCSLNERKNKIPIKDLIENFFDYKKTVKNKIHDYINGFIDCWNAHINELYFEKIQKNQFDMFLHNYEIIDFDYTIYDGITRKSSKKKIKDIFESGDYDLIKQFAGFSKMSHYYSLYDIEKLDKFISSNFGNRDDELWIINEERFIRHHPEAKTNKYNTAFFSDAKLVFEILLQQETCLEYVNIWVNKYRNDFRNKLVKSLKNKKKNNDVELFLENIAHLSDIFSDKYLTQRNVKHSFFYDIYIRAVDVLKIDNLMTITKESFTDLYTIHSLYTSQKSSNHSLNLNRKMNHLTIWMIILGALTLLLTTITTIKTFSDSRNKRNNVTNEVKIDSESDTKTVLE